MMNASYINHSCFNQSLNDTTSTTEESRMAFLVCYSILLFLAVFGNLCVVVIVWKNRQMQTNINFLVVNMAVSDLSGSLVTIPRMISLTIKNSNEWTLAGVFADVLCKLCPFIRDVSISVSIESMVAIAFDRFFAVVFPLQSIPQAMRPRIVLPTIWFLAMVPFSLNFVTFQIAYFEGKRVCAFIWPSVFDRAEVHHVYFIGAIMILFFVIPLVIVSVLYYFIVWKMKRSAIPGQQLCEQEKRRQKLNSSIVNMAIVIVLSFFVCWFPYHTLTIFEFFVWKQNLEKNAPSFYHDGFLRDILTFISYISLAINPFICFVFSSNYRNCLKKLFPFYVFFSNHTRGLNVKTQRTAATYSQEMINFNNGFR